MYLQSKSGIIILVGLDANYMRILLKSFAFFNAKASVSKTKLDFS